MSGVTSPTNTIQSPWDASNPAFISAIQNANAIFITGGDQSRYGNTPRGIASAGSPAVQVDKNGNAQVVGNGAAYFITAPGTIPSIYNGPLNWMNIEVIKVNPGVQFNLNTLTSGGGIPVGTRYWIDVVNGRLAVRGNNDIY